MPSPRRSRSSRSARQAPARGKASPRQPKDRTRGRHGVGVSADRPTIEVLVSVQGTNQWWRVHAPSVPDADGELRAAASSARTVGSLVACFGVIFDSVTEFLAQYAEDLGWDFDESTGACSRQVGPRRVRITPRTRVRFEDLDKAGVIESMMETALDALDSQEEDSLAEIFPNPDTEPRVRGLLRHESWSSPGGGGPNRVYFIRGEEGLRVVEQLVNGPTSTSRFRIAFKRV